jgi:hypothetical protein
VGVEARGDQDEVGAVGVEAGQNLGGDDRAEGGAAGARAEGDVEDGAEGPVWEEAPEPGQNGNWWVDTKRMRESCSTSASVPLPWWTSKSTMATRWAPCRSTARRAAQRHVAEQAEAHGAWRPARGGRAGAWRRRRGPGHRDVHRLEGGPGAEARGAKRAGREPGVGVERDLARRGLGPGESLKIGRVVERQELLVGRLARLLAPQVQALKVSERGGEPVGPLGVAMRRRVAGRVGMGEENHRGHGRQETLSCAPTQAAKVSPMRSLFALLLLAGPAAAQDWQPNWEVSADLDGDGAPELYRLEPGEDLAVDLVVGGRARSGGWRASPGAAGPASSRRSG